MEQRKYDKKDATRLMLVCAAVYFFSYLARINYAAVLVEIISAQGYTKEAASVALTGLFVAYGVGQIVSGYLGDKLAPHKLVFTGMLVCSGMNLLLPLCPGPQWMTVLWSVNGLSQAMLWPPLMRLTTQRLISSDFKTCSMGISWGGNFGSVVVYLAAPMLISLGGWKCVFYISGVLVFCMALVWRVVYPRLEARLPLLSSVAAPDSSAPAPRIPRSVAPLLAAIMVAIIMQGVLRDGVTTWTPAYLVECFQLKSGTAILTSVALPLFSILIYRVALWLNQRVFSNELVCAAVLFLAAVVSLVLLRLVGSFSAVLSLILMMFAVGAAHGVNFVLICLTPPYFSRYGKISFMSGLLNSCTYVGSALSTYGIAVLLQNRGWNATMIAWYAIAMVGLALCVLFARAWARFKRQQDEM